MHASAYADIRYWWQERTRLCPLMNHVQSSLTCASFQKYYCYYYSLYLSLLLLLVLSLSLSLTLSRARARCLTLAHSLSRARTRARALFVSRARSPSRTRAIYYLSPLHKVVDALVLFLAVCLLLLVRTSSRCLSRGLSLSFQFSCFLSYSHSRWHSLSLSVAARIEPESLCLERVR